MFYATSVRFNKDEKHLLFTNVKELPVLGGRKVSDMLADLNIEVLFTDFKYKTPKGYFDMFQNQFYEFSILEYIVNNSKIPSDNYLILDSDCIFIKPVKHLFDEAKKQGFLSFEDDCTTELVIHGLSRRDMKALYEDLLGNQIADIPGYHLGEFFLANVENINTIFSGFLELWPEMLRRYRMNLPKFNEEAQTLSYLYYKNNFVASKNRKAMKRIWTNPVFYRNVEASDLELAVWHLPSEKTYGLSDLYDILITKQPNYGFELRQPDFIKIVSNALGIPRLSTFRKAKYYVLSYFRALRKRTKKWFA